MQSEIPAESLLGIPRWNNVRNIKVLRPRLSGTTIPRKRLIDRLTAFRQGAVTLIIAPPGFGKTTVMAQWCGEPNVRSAWLTFDGHERTIPQFLSAITASLSHGLPDFTTEWSRISAVLDEESPSTSGLMRAFIDAVSCVSAEISLILDDYHLVESNEIHAFLNRLIDHLPKSMHVTIGSRTTPALQIPRLRALGLLHEIRASQLKLQGDEAATLLIDALGLKLSTEQIHRLEEKTGGWVAGIQLAAISLQEHTDVDQMLESFGGVDPYVLGHIAEDVVQRLPHDLRDFLLKTSILDRLNAGLCDYLTEGTNGNSMLERLEQLNLFITSLDEHREWYRYHRLFADLLQARLERGYGVDYVRGLHDRASTWFMQSGCIELGVEHSLKSGDGTAMSRIIEPAGLPMILEFKSLRNSILALPRTKFETSSCLAKWAGWTMLTAGQFGLAARYADMAARTLDASTPGADSDLLTLQARIASVSGDVSRGVDWAIAGWDKTPQGDQTRRLTALYVLGMAYKAAGQPRQAEAAFVDGQRCLDKSISNLTQTLSVLIAGGRARSLLLQGRLNDSATVLDEAVTIAIDNALPRAGYTAQIRSELLLYRYRLTSARQLLEESLALSQMRGQHLYRPSTLILLTSVHSALGDVDGALSRLGELRKWTTDIGSPRLMTFAETAYMQTLIHVGRHTEVGLWVDRVLPDRDIKRIPYELEGAFGVHAELLIDQGIRLSDRGQIDKGLRVLDVILNTQNEASRLLDTASTQGLRAIALNALGSTDYVEALAFALRPAVEEGACYPILRHGDRARQMLTENEKEPTLGPIIGAMRERLESQNELDVPTIEALSDRERDVLNRLSSGLSTKEIAESLFVSLNTIKSHTRHIYEKLGADNRTHAIDRARDLGLLD